MLPRFDILIPDVNGILRGLSAPLADADKLLTQPVPWSSSLFSSRFDGAVVEETGHGLQVGDPDFPLRAVPDTTAAVPWHEGGEGRQALFAMYRPSGEPFELDPQHALQGVIDRLAKDGLNSILATEFEFYLSDGNAAAGQGGARTFPGLYSLSEIDRQDDFLTRVSNYTAAQKLPAGNIISEYGAGQWEINLHHADARRAVCEGLMLQRAVRVAALRTGQRATFMAKPLAGASGSGMHIHISLWKDGKNCFADDEVLGHAVAGVLAVCSEAMAFFAPYDNSYRRLLPGSYAPCEVSWGRENRSVAVRLPMAETDEEKRLEFRLCGADANPVTAAAALLAGIHWGISNKLTPPPPHESGSAGGGDTVPLTWRAALDAFASAKILPDYVDSRFLQNYLCVKENEWRHHRAHISDYDREFYGREI